MSLQDLIASHNERLTPTDRRIAEAVLADPTLLVFGTVSDLAERMETSRPSIIRFAGRLGFGGYTELQRWARSEAADRLATPSQRIRRDGVARTSVGADITRAIEAALDQLTEDRLRAIASLLGSSRAVWIVSGETSRAGAVVLRSGLSMVRDRVRLVEEHDLGRELSGAGATDSAVIFDFARYRRATMTAAEALKALGVRMVAITDGPLSPLVPYADAWCELSVPAVGPFDSSVPAVLAAELIVHELVRQNGQAARERIDRLEQVWQRTGTFVD